MATWSDLLGAKIPSLPKQVFLCTGEISTLVWDAVHQTLKGYDFYVRVGSQGDLRYSVAALGTNAAYLVVDPDDLILKAVEDLIRSGATEAVFILISGDGTDLDKETFDYVKKKSQQSKQYYTITAPKGEQARSKMESFFIMRWGVSRDLSQKTCSILEYSPGQLYQFDKQFMLCTDGQVLPSSHTQSLVDELLGSDTPNLVLMKIASRIPVDMNFGEDFTYKALKMLHNLLNHARIIQGAWYNGESTVAGVAKATGLSHFLVLRAWGLAEAYGKETLKDCEDLVLFGMDNVSGNPELLSVISRTFGR